MTWTLRSSSDGGSASFNLAIPDRIKQLVSDQRGTIIVRPDDSQFSLSYWFNHREEPLATLERDDIGITKYKALLETDVRLAKADLIFRIGKKHALQRELSLPAAAKGNLYQVVTYELSRFSPFSPDHAYYAVKVLDVINEPGQIRVMLILTSKDVLDGFYRDIKAFGMAPKLVDYEERAKRPRGRRRKLQPPA